MSQQYRCLKCNTTFENEDLAVKHQWDTDSYSPMTGETRLHKLEEVKE